MAIRIPASDVWLIIESLPVKKQLHLISWKKQSVVRNSQFTTIVRHIY